MLEITKQKWEFLQEIYRLTQEQSEAIAQKQFKTFLSLSRDKQILIEKVLVLDDSFQQQYDDVKTKAGSEEYFAAALSKQINLKEMQQLVAEIEKLTDDIKLLEVKNKEAYRKMLLEIMVPLNKSMINREEKILQYKRMNDYKKRKMEH
ncbi:MAG: hypothetical protein MJB12_04950 [Firmicutes bacterium]|nr:hypothetical protein [Bacillota bacterium]